MTSEYDIHCNEAVMFEDDDIESIIEEKDFAIRQLKRDIAEIQLAKPLWGLWGFVLGAVSGIALMGVVMHSMGVK